MHIIGIYNNIIAVNHDYYKAVLSLIIINNIQNCSYGYNTIIQPVVGILTSNWRCIYHIMYLSSSYM